MEYRNPEHYDRKPYAFERKNYPVASEPQLLRIKNSIPDDTQKKKIAVISSLLKDVESHNVMISPKTDGKY